MSIEAWLVVPTWVLVGLIWMVQIVHYPLFHGVGAERFCAFHRDHMRRIAPLVLCWMLLEVGATLWMLMMRPGDFWIWAGALLLAVIWGSTFAVQVPLHRRLERGFDESVVGQLVRTNWVRTIAWSLRGLVLQIAVSSPN